MTWEQLVLPVLLVLVLLVRRLRMRKGTDEEAQGDEVEPASVPVAMDTRVPIREPRRLGEVPRRVRLATDPSPAGRRWQPRVAVNLRDMRRGIVLMAVLGPCRGREAWSARGELDRG